jgi:hypothetical protein
MFGVDPFIIHFNFLMEQIAFHDRTLEWSAVGTFQTVNRILIAHVAWLRESVRNEVSLPRIVGTRKWPKIPWYLA